VLIQYVYLPLHFAAALASCSFAAAAFFSMLLRWALIAVLAVAAAAESSHHFISPCTFVSIFHWISCRLTTTCRFLE